MTHDACSRELHWLATSPTNINFKFVVLVYKCLDGVDEAGFVVAVSKLHSVSVVISRRSVDLT